MNKYDVENIPQPFRKAFEINTAEETVKNDLNTNEEEKKQRCIACRRNSSDMTQALLLLVLLDIM